MLLIDILDVMILTVDASKTEISVRPNDRNPDWCRLRILHGLITAVASKIFLVPGFCNLIFLGR